VAGERLAPSILAGLGWKATSQLVSLAAHVVSVVVVARLLGPNEFGIAAMALGFSALGTTLADAALGSALVQRRGLTDLDRSTAFWLSLGTGAVLALAGVLLAGAVASFYREPEVAPLFAALSAGFLLGSLTSTPVALLTREMRFRTLELAHIAAAVLGTITAVSVAVAGGGAWAIVIQQLVGLTVVGTISWVAARWRPRLAWSGKSFRELGGFTLNVLGTRVFFYLQRNADNLIVGRALGAGPLGAYALAYNVMMLPFARVVDPLRAVLFPAFASVQADTGRVGELWLRGTRSASAVLFPAMLGLVVVAPDLVAVVLGASWAPAVDPLRILAVVGLLQAVIVLNSTVLTAVGRTQELLWFSALTFVLSVVGFLVGVQYGIAGVATGYLVANLLVIPLYVRLTSTVVGVSGRSFAGALAGTAQAAAGMFVAVVAVRAGLVATGVPAGARLVLVVVLGTTVAAALTAWRAPKLVAELRELPHLARSRRAAAG
jgi:O-antigen/teichoic acid export membrane protein